MQVTTVSLERLLYISDLDGTMLLPDRTVGPRTRAVVERLVQAGGLFTVATGRCAASAARVLGGLRLPLAAIVHNGAQTVDLQRGKTVELVTMEGPLVGRLLCESMARGLSPQAYVWTPEQSVELVHGPAKNAPTGRYTGVMAEVLPARLFDGSPQQLRWLERCQGLSFLFLDARDVLETFFAEQCSTAAGVATSLGRSAYTRGIAVGEIQSEHATKANAARRLIRSLGLTAEQLVAFGDNANDLPLLRLAGHAYCPPEAPAGVLAEVPGRIRSCRDEGVARYLERVLERPTRTGQQTL